MILCLPPPWFVLLQFVGIHVPDFYCVGTPVQLRSFLGLVRTGVIKPRHKARVCFDLDRSFRVAHSGSGVDETVSVRPVTRIVRLVQVCMLKVPSSLDVRFGGALPVQKGRHHGNERLGRARCYC